MALKDMQIASVKALIDSAPDSVIRSLEAALKADQGGGATPVIRDLVNAEAVERQACAAVFAPILKLCEPPVHDLVRLRFPEGTPRRLWRALKQGARSDVEHAVAAWLGRAWSDSSPPVFEKLCARAAKSLRDGDPDFAAVVASLEQAEPGSMARFITLLEMAPLERVALESMAAWVARTSGAHAAAMRLIYKDAGRCGEKAGPLLLELLLAHMTEPWSIMKVVAALMDTPNERYVAASELASFPERLMDSIDQAVGTIRDMDATRGAPAGLEAAQAVARALATLQALEGSLSLQKDAPWSKRIAHQRRALAGAVEARLHDAEQAVEAALPVQTSRLAARALTGLPKLVHPPEPRLVAKAAALLAFVWETRGSAEGGGFGTLRDRVQKGLERRLQEYGDDLLEMLHAGAETPDDAACMRQYLEATAELVDVLQEKAGATLRRRAAAA